MSYNDEFVQAVNNTDEMIEWDSITLAPGQRRIIPYMNMCNSYGDPASVPGRHQIVMIGNERGVIQPREVERDRAANYWAIKDRENPMSWDTVAKITFLDMDGEKLYTPVEDPLGERVAPAAITMQQQNTLEETVRRQQRQIEQLLEIAGLDHDALPETDAPVTSAPEVPYDTSTADNTQSPWAHSENVGDVDAFIDRAGIVNE